MRSARFLARAGALLLASLGVLLGSQAPALAAPPTLTITQPQAGSSTSERMPTFSGTTSNSSSLDPVTVKIYSGAAASGSPVLTLKGLSPEMGQWSGAPQTPLAPGEYTAQAEQESSVGGERGKSQPITFSVDAMPAASINPVATPTNDPAPPLSGSAATGTGDQPAVEIRISEVEPAAGAIASKSVPVSGGTWSYTPPHLSDGTYTALAEQKNEAGESASSSPVSFTVDTTPPAVTVMTPANDGILNVSATAFRGSAGGAGGDVQSVSVKLYPGAPASGSPLQTLELSAAEWQAGVAGPALANGIYTVVAEQRDLAGNLGTSQAIFAVAAPAAPPPAKAAGPPTAAFEFLPSQPHVNETVSLISTSTDASSPITDYAWAVGAHGAFSAHGPLFSTSFSTPGSYLVRLLVTNAAGLSSVVGRTIAVRATLTTLIQPFPIVRIAGSDFATHVKIGILSVQAPFGALVTVSCHGRGCPIRHLSRRVRTSKGPAASGRIFFARFQRSLPVGVVLEIRVSEPGEIGKYTRFVVRHGKLPLRSDRCLNVAGTSPIACPN